jgi:hypothetical protein
MMAKMTNSNRWMTMRSSTIVLVLFSHLLTLEEALSELSKGDFAYKEVSDVSDVTEESYPEGMQMLRDGVKDLENIDKLMDQTKKKLKIVDGNIY